jgi:hypothetical protein
MGTSIKSYRDLEVWQKGIVLTRSIYQATTEEKFGLVNQMRRAAVSIPSNVAEGHARSSTAEFQRFIMIAMGSVAELEIRPYHAAPKPETGSQAPNPKPQVPSPKSQIQS